MSSSDQDSGNSRQKRVREKSSEQFRKVHLVIALLISVVSLLVYMTTLVPGVLPGEPAEVLASLSGVNESLVMRHLIWRKLVALAVSLRGSSFVFDVNIMCTVFSALGIGMLYLVASSLVNLMMDREHLQLTTVASARKNANMMSVLAGVFASVALAFSAPYWVSATQPYFHSFYLFWLLLSVLMLLRFGETLKFSYLYAFCLLHGAGMTQTSCFVAFAPLCYAYALFILWSNDRLSGRTFGRLILLSLLGGCLFFVNAAEFYGSPGYVLLGANGYLAVLKMLVRGVLDGVFGSLPRVGWMIVLGMTVAPCLAILLTGHRALNGEKDWSFYALHGVVFIVTVAVILDTRASPWQFYNVESLQIVPYAMMSLTFGYLLAYLFSLTLYLFPAEVNGKPNRPPQYLRYGAVLLASALSVYAFINNRGDADHKRMNFVWVYADTLLDNLDGRTWLLTNGVFDDVVRVRAKERGIEVNMLNLSQANSKVALKIIKSKLKNIRLRNSADIGLFPLIQEWITSERDVASELGLCLFPDLWNVGDYEVYPHGLAFYGANPEQMEQVRKKDLMKPYLDMMDEFAPVLAAVPEDVSRRNEFYKQMVKGQVSFIGNNLGYLLETSGRKDEAFEVYSRVHAFDPNNVSALLNYATMIQAGMHPELKDKVMSELEAFQRRLSAPLEIWSLSRTFGYVSSPEAFAKLGWTWAMSGQSNLALKSLTRALKELQPENRGKLRSVIADVYMQSNDRTGGERVYKEILAEDPGDHGALIGLVRINVMNGNAAKAQEYLNMAKAAGVPRERLLYEAVALELMAGDIPRARIIAQELVDFNPNNAEAHVVMSVIFSQLYEDAATPEASDEALKGMQKSIAELERVSGPKDFQTLFVKGRMNMLTKNYSESRENFKEALQNARSPNVVPIMDSILRMDHALVDKTAALKTSMEILHRDPGHSFANYIMGSLALEREDYLSAEDYLKRSLETSPDSIFVLNDLAVAEIKLSKYDEAESLVRRSFAVDDGIYAAWDTLGEILMVKGKIDEAAEAFSTALRLNDKDLRVHLHVAQLHYRKGELDKSRDIIRKLGAGSDLFTGDDLRDYEELAQALLGKRDK